MYKIILSKDAEVELYNIWWYIAEDNLFYAQEILNKIDNSINMIAEFPFLWKEIEWWVRRIVETRYKFKIVYIVRGKSIYIVSIFKYKNIWE